jgi:large subunit ribosomal protein L15
LKIQDLKPAKGSTKKPKRVGRGTGSGHGKTSCRGHKGQNSRSGGGVRQGFEGGQMPYQRRLPKRGFHNPFSKRYAILNIRDIDRLGLDTVTPEVLREKGVIKSLRDGLKILGDGDIGRAVSVKANSFSISAAEKIRTAGGTAEVI